MYCFFFLKITGKYKRSVKQFHLKPTTLIRSRVTIFVKVANTYYTIRGITKATLGVGFVTVNVLPYICNSSSA